MERQEPFTERESKLIVLAEQMFWLLGCGASAEKLKEPHKEWNAIVRPPPRQERG